MPEKIESESVDNTVLKGSVTVEDNGSESKVTYMFKNISKQKVTVVGGAKYNLYKDGKLLDEGSVPVTDYISLEPDHAYQDKKIFSNLTTGNYRVEIRWAKATAAAEFVRK